MMREFVCPRCGLVLEASVVDGVVWMGEHVARCDVPARAVFTALGQPMGTHMTEMLNAMRGLKERKREKPLAFTWAETLSVADAEFLHGLGIDPL